MCDTIQFFRIFLFFVGWLFLTVSVIYANRCSKKKGINMNTFLGMLEMWGMVFRFENKKLSIMLLTSAYGGAVLAIVILILTHWGQSQGCVFPINDRTMR
ncbi:hypothetical protein MF6396_01690 [Pseudomonas sp. MF6396]|uniref:hypothetical protein n=1 Tax=Pseudomonas sp. MF6396 TaxID=1960828 RepID=UPI000995FD80|nr:hypothetical protein [Pseudomonas sp. MF6396]OOW06391.1 hypothetical protein MF6396_01690 [Pseudomonas sp. MF6396]